MNNESFYSQPILPSVKLLVANLAPSPPLKECCQSMAAKEFANLCTKHEVHECNRTLTWFRYVCTKNLPTMFSIKMLNNTDIYFVKAPGKLLCEMEVKQCMCCGASLKIIIISSALLDLIYQFNMTTLSLASVKNGKVFIRPPDNREIIEITKVFNSHIAGHSGHAFRASATKRKPTNINLKNLNDIIELSLIYLILHEFGHTINLFAPRIEINLETHNSLHSLTEPQKRKWRREISADIEGAFMLLELFSEYACMTHGFKIGVAIYAAKMAFGAALGALESLHVLDVISPSGKLKSYDDLSWESISTKHKWRSHPPFLIRSDYLQFAAEKHSEWSFRGEDILDYHAAMHMARKALFDAYLERLKENER